MAEVDTFGLPGSLLAPADPVDSGHDESVTATMTDTFVLTGLLGAGRAAAEEEMRTESNQQEVTEEPMEVDGSRTQANEVETEDVFVSTGLLSAEPSNSGSATTQNGLPPTNSTSQESELPEVTELLRPYARADTSTSSTTISNFASTSYIVRASNFDGKPVMLKRRPRRAASSASILTESSSAQRFGKLLEVPIHRLLDELSTDEAIRLSRSDPEAAVAAQQPSGTATTKSKEREDSALWVDRYRPKRFTDLLGDDRVHREVMSWVKEWDYCVFGRKQGRGVKRPRGEDGDNLDEWKRPNEKILLLSGPPGLGKTTLAHVVARHAGYQAFEINASDARSAQVVDDRLRPALESGSAVGSSKPVLVVIDEIDGATGGSDHSAGFIRKLLSLTYDRPRKKGRKADPKASRPLLRPIICICNDLYANSLRDLRTYARIVRFSRPNDIHLVRRIREICEIEGLRTESRALTALVGIAQGDLRGCLNTLQLIKAKGKEVTESVIRTAAAGMKQSDMTSTTVLNDLFSPMARKRTKDLGLTEEEEARYVRRLSREVESTGAMDRVAEGCFEYYATFHQHDANFSRYLKANEWLASYDMLSGEMWTEREFALAEYLPFMLVGFYPLFQERGRPKLERPKATWDHHVATTTNQEIYVSLARCLRSAASRLHGDYRHLASDQILHLELAPYLNRIISPPLNPVNRQIIRPSEKATLARLVDVMVALELRFLRDKNDDGQLVYRLDPPIDVFVTYDGKRASDIALSKYAVRHLVATEIDDKLAAMRIEPAEKSKPKRSDFFSRTTDGARVDTIGPEDSASLPAAKRSKQDQTTPAEKVAVDFFGRPILPKASSSDNDAAGTKKTSKKPIVKYRVAYRFHEGNSAAVRKHIKVSAFL
ncbi:P-loop containing nucleoside triphosphate hydrolase protein [Daedalea quercina L-15889]|uniref:p-loop containing nucleoside triphosphate hydrolase protein n=1 Tax=Daedalea quercina L-15889 TaxID=1314783 RepID=A0A165S0Q1_9APHY|nr:P-loop containing nucleoside triphosphate hydrolase protein [Daedalea quercina L-15889]